MQTYEIAQRWTLTAGLLLSVIFLAYSVFVIFFTDGWPASHLTTLYQVVLILLSVTYVERENRKFQHVYHPHEFGLFVWMFWPFFFPYYLIKTRGAFGVAIFVGTVALLFIQSAVYLAWDLSYAEAG